MRDHEREVAVTDDVDLDVVQVANPLRREDLVDRSRGEHPAILDHHERAADSRRERQVMSRHDDRQAAFGMEGADPVAVFAALRQKRNGY